MTNTQWIFLKLLRLWKAGCVGGTLQGIGNIGENKSRVHNLIIYQIPVSADIPWLVSASLQQLPDSSSHVISPLLPLSSSYKGAVASECGCQEESRKAKEPKRVRPSCSHTHTPQTPRKRMRITGKGTANQLQGCIAVGTPSFSWLPELLLLSPGFGFSMAHGNPASSVYAAQKKDLLVELWPGSPRSQARGLRGQGDAGEDPGWDG
ncbi:unnamed protein product [Rangifer tarandus platyrhynchus]|uniref:Uncharacterized protein n=1 Tax=Rangifer tarandus platyrhynchus TaxID=3082113 RepID=A0ABN8ZAA1_RANTA|nr:unnamed protein product [Rangifer tarandus platyrhynchus]